MWSQPRAQSQPWVEPGISGVSVRPRAIPSERKGPSRPTAASPEQTQVAARGGQSGSVPGLSEGGQSECEAWGRHDRVSLFLL